MKNSFRKRGGMKINKMDEKIVSEVKDLSQKVLP